MWYRIADRWRPPWQMKSLCPNDIGLWVTSVSRAQIHKFWISCWWILFAFEEQTRSIARGLNAAQGRVPAPNAKLIGSLRAHGTHLYVCRVRNVCVRWYLSHKEPTQPCTAPRSSEWRRRFSRTKPPTILCACVKKRRWEDALVSFWLKKQTAEFARLTDAEHKNTRAQV